MPTVVRKLIWSATLLASIGVAADLSAQAPTAPGANTATPTPQNTQLLNPRDEMRKFIRAISQNARRLDPNFVVMTQDGLELLEQVDSVDTTRRVPASTYIRSLDGLLVRGMFFRPPEPDDRDKFVQTDTRVSAELSRLADVGKARGHQVLIADYVVDGKMALNVIKLGLGKGYVPFVTTGRGFSFDHIPTKFGRPINENPTNITGIKHAKNYLYMLDSSRYDRQEEFVEALANTNYDAVIIDLFHRGRQAFTPENIKGMRFKKLGARRLVLAYLNVGQAETFRYYWQPNWRSGSPSFIASAVSGHSDRYYVRFWDAGWQNMIAAQQGSYLQGVLRQGFDGVLLDGVEAYKFFEGSVQ